MSQSGVSAAALAEAVQVGPEEVDEAGDLVSKAGLKHQAKELIGQVAAINPPELVAALTRKEDAGRTKCLDNGEVERFTKEIVGEDLERVLKARVRGSQAKPERMKVVVLFELPSTRTARCVFDYARCKLSQVRYEKALAAGEVDLAEKKPGEDDHAALRRQNERLEDEVRRLSSQVAEISQAAPVAEGDAPAPTAEEFATLREELASLRAKQEDAREVAEGEARDETEDQKPAVEIPKNATEITSKVREFSDEQLAELAKDSRSTVAAAATAEVERRKEK